MQCNAIQSVLCARDEIYKKKKKRSGHSIALFLSFIGVVVFSTTIIYILSWPRVHVPPYHSFSDRLFLSISLLLSLSISLSLSHSLDQSLSSNTILLLLAPESAAAMAAFSLCLANHEGCNVGSLRSGPAGAGALALKGVVGFC